MFGGLCGYFGAVLHHIQLGNGDCQDIVEIMRDATCELRDTGHFLRTLKSCLALADFGTDFLVVYLGQAPTPVPGLGFGGAAIGAILAAGFAGRRIVRRR